MKLSKNDIDLLANRALDILQASNDERFDTVRKSDDYRLFETAYSDEVVEKLKKLELEEETISEKIKDLEASRTKVRNEVRGLSEDLNFKYRTQWSNQDQVYCRGGEMLEAWLKAKKDAKFPGVAFNKEKLLNKLKTDLLVSSAKNAQEALDEIVKING